MGTILTNNEVHVSNSKELGPAFSSLPRYHTTIYRSPARSIKTLRDFDFLLLTSPVAPQNPLTVRINYGEEYCINEVFCRQA